MAQTTLNTKTEDGDPQSITFHLEDDHAEDEAEVLQSLASRAERSVDRKAKLEETEEELSATKELVINEIVRRKKLSGEVGEEADFSEEDEVEYLEGLPAERLQKEWERAMDLDVNTSSATDPDADPPTNGKDEGVYDDLAVSA